MSRHRAVLYGHAIEARAQLASWSGFDLRGYPPAVCRPAWDARRALEELCDVLREGLTAEELDVANHLAWNSGAWSSGDA